MRPLAVLLLSFCAVVSTTRADDAAPVTRTVVVLHQFESNFPATVQSSRGIESVLGAHGYSLSIEYLDTARRVNLSSELDLARWYAAKYAGRRVDLVVAVGGESLRFLVTYRKVLWPESPIVFCAVFNNLGPLLDLPPGITGRTVRLPVRSNIDIALRLLPKTRRVFYLGGTSAVDRGLSSIFWDAMREYPQLPVTDLTGMTYEEMGERLATAPEDAIAVAIASARDGAGRQLTGPAQLALWGTRARVPIFAMSTTVLGHGIVGGRLVEFQELGREAGQLALRVLEGQAPETIPIAESATSILAFDARQLDRWGIDRTLLPAGADLLFSPPPPIYTRPPVIATLVCVLALQAALIGWLLVERRRRRRFEREARETQGQIAHMNRVAVVGELTATLAHEVANPLAAMLNDARAARRFIDAPLARLAEARASIHALEEQGQRARDVLLQMRRALRKDVEEPPVSDLSQAVRDAVRLVQSDAREDGISLEAAFPAAGPVVTCHPVQLQQVLLNLLLNAIDAVRTQPSERRRVRVDVQPGPESVEVTVRDWGKGISTEERARLFEPFFTTKSTGLGMGLSISRSIVEAHGGRLVAHTEFDQGAAFSFVLPLDAATEPRPSLEAV